MSQFFHTPIPVGSPANASTFNSVFTQLDFGVGIQGGGANARDSYLLNYWMVALNHIAEITGTTGEGLITGAKIIWPDGSVGEYTVLDDDPSWIEAIEWEMTHDDSGNKIVFSGLTRDTDGNIKNPGSFLVEPI